MNQVFLLTSLNNSIKYQTKIFIINLIDKQGYLLYYDNIKISRQKK